MKKRIISVLCALTLVVTAAGCNGNTAENTTTTEQPSVSVEQQTKTAAEPETDNAETTAEEETVEIPEDEPYVIENGITARMKALSTYVKGNQARLAKVFKKAQNGEKITVAYLGGSITQGSSAGDGLCYSKLTTDWLMEKFPNAEIEYVRAGIGATGSYIGVFRADRDVISKNPDLVFIDFSVNDTTEYTQRNINSYDSLLRKLWNSSTSPAIVTIAMTQEDGTSFQQYHADICKAYQIPMISYREAILDVIKNGHIKWTDISDDNIHPNVTGHAVLTEIITSYLQDVIDNLDNIDTENESDFSTPYTENKYENANMLVPESYTPVESTGWENNPTLFGNFGGYWTVRTKDGTFDGVSPLKFEVTGAKTIGLLYGKLTTAGGTFDVLVDGELAKTIDSSFPGGWGNYVEAEEIIDFDEPGDHTVEIVPQTGKKCVINISAVTFA